MQAIKLMVTGAQALVTQAPTVTSGMVGLPVELNFDAQWDAMEKTLVFKAGPVSRTQTQAGEQTVVPWEVLAQPGHTLRIGVYGTSQDGQTIPTVWATVGLIQEGAAPSGDPDMDPQLPVWQQLSNRIRALETEMENTPQSLGYFEFHMSPGLRLGDESISFLRPDGSDYGWEEYDGTQWVFFSLPNALRELFEKCKTKKALWVKLKIGVEGYEEIVPAVYSSGLTQAYIPESIRFVYPIAGGSAACSISFSAECMNGPLEILDMLWAYGFTVEVFGM